MLWYWNVFFSLMNWRFLRKFQISQTIEPVNETTIVCRCKSDFPSLYKVNAQILLFSTCFFCINLVQRARATSHHVQLQHVMVAHSLVDTFQTNIKTITFAKTVFVFANFVSVLIFPVILDGYSCINFLVSCDYNCVFMSLLKNKWSVKNTRFQ